MKRLPKVLRETVCLHYIKCELLSWKYIFKVNPRFCLQVAIYQKNVKILEKVCSTKPYDICTSEYYTFLLISITNRFYEGVKNLSPLSHLYIKALDVAIYSSISEIDDTRYMDTVKPYFTKRVNNMKGIPDWN